MKFMSMTVTKKMAKDACDRLGHQMGPVNPNILGHYSFPKMFPTTAGPFGGIAGQGFTEFQIDLFACGGVAEAYCNGRYWTTITGFRGVASLGAL